jgi:hypothetical protein
MGPALRTACILLACHLAAHPAFAGSSAAGGARRFPADEIAVFSKKIEQVMAAKGARVFLIARIGRPLSELPEGVRYTHTGFAVYSTIEYADGSHGPGYAMYNLYQQPGARDASHLVVDYPADFFSGAVTLEAGIVIPVPELQKKLLDIIGTPAYARLHNPRYSLLSNPADPRYQNCNEFVLDVIQAAVYRTDDRGTIKANNQAYFTPQKVRIGSVKLLLGSIFRADIRTGDHQGAVATATFGSLARYLSTYGLSQDQLKITPDAIADETPTARGHGAAAGG